MSKNFDPTIGVSTRWRKGGPSPNPGGRPKSRLLTDALRIRLGDIKPDDPEQRTWAEVMASNLIEIACSKSPGAVAAANEICDRLEGRSPQSIQISDLDADLRSRSDEELMFHLANNRWPTDKELAALRAGQSLPA